MNPATERAESLRSVRTDTDFILSRYIKDIKEQPDGREDDPIMCEDYTGHHGDGEFEDVERESLQGFGDDEELVEADSASIAGGTSPRDRSRKLMLNGTPMQNQPHQSSMRRDEAMEMSPLRTSPTVIPSIVSSYTPSSSTGVPLPESQRTIPDGYVEDQNINVKSEGFSNPVCTPSPLESIAGRGGPVPPATSTPTNQTPAHSGHMTSHMIGPHLQLRQQQSVTPANHTPRTSRTASLAQMQPSRDESQTAMLRTVSTAAEPSNGGYVQQSSQLPGIQVIPQPPFAGGGSSFNLIDLSSNSENSTQNLSLQPSLGAHTLSADGYVQEPASMTSGGDSSVRNLNSQPPLGTSAHTLTSDGYVREPPSMTDRGEMEGYLREPASITDGGEREERGPSAESGNEEDSLSNEGDSNSVFDDELIPSENPVHSVRPRSTVTSGFQSGSSESTSSHEPPRKSTSSTSSLLSSVSTVAPPSTQCHAPAVRKDDDASPSSTNFSLILQQTSPSNLSSDSFLPHSPPSLSSPSTSPTPVTESTFVSTAANYRPSSTGGSSGYVTNESSRSYTYHSSSATSQTSQSSGVAQSDLEQVSNVEGADGRQNYTIPSLLSCSSKSSSPAVSRTAWTTSDMSIDSTNTRHYPHHLQATKATVTDYVNTSDVDLNTISTELGALSQSSARDRAGTGDQGVSFFFPTSAS